MNEWYTPKVYLDAVREVLGTIDVDPASSILAQQTVQALQYFSIVDCGLAVPWLGKVFLNPPYSTPDIWNFIKKLLLEWQSARVTEAIVLTNNSSDTGWFHDLLAASSVACLTKGRVSFYNTDAKAPGQPRQGQCFFYFGANSKGFAHVFSQFGITIQTYDHHRL